ncbi:MAG: hypothetical protein AAGM38_15600 [Pseudomonadota bacterium]
MIVDRPEPAAADDVTEPVLDAMLEEALALTEEIALLGLARRAMEAPNSLESALRLHLTARLSRIAAWASLRSAHDPERREIAHQALEGAVLRRDIPISLEEASRFEPESQELRLQVDRLALRALRLDALLDGRALAELMRDEPDPSAISVTPGLPAPSAVILPFPDRARRADQAPAAERVADAEEAAETGAEEADLLSLAEPADAPR